MNDKMVPIHPQGEGFVERITPKKPEEDLFLFACPTCDGKHFRHAGYVQSLLPFIRPQNEKRMSCDNVLVLVCVACRKCYCWINEQMYDVTGQLDLQAWEKAEIELHKATGPGGEC